VTLPNWTREPLVHFLIAGLVLFALLGWRGEPVDPASRLIEVGQAEQAQLALQFERTMSRAPTDAELDAQIERFVRDEVLYREALRLGLDRGDAVVQRRLVSKMDMSASAAAEAAEPDQATLQAFFEDNRERYTGAGTISFDQIHFKDADTARAALGGLEGQSDWRDSGDPISLPPSMESTRSAQIETRFGEVFVSAIEALQPSNEWQGPIRSGFGWHVVRLRERISNDSLTFDSVRDRVENDWRSEQVASRKARAFQVLRDAYRVEIDR